MFQADVRVMTVFVIRHSDLLKNYGNVRDTASTGMRSKYNKSWTRLAYGLISHDFCRLVSFTVVGKAPDANHNCLWWRRVSQEIQFRIFPKIRFLWFLFYLFTGGKPKPAFIFSNTFNFAVLFNCCQRPFFIPSFPTSKSYVIALFSAFLFR